MSDEETQGGPAARARQLLRAGRNRRYQAPAPGPQDTARQLAATRRLHDLLDTGAQAVVDRPTRTPIACRSGDRLAPNTTCPACQLPVIRLRGTTISHIDLDPAAHPAAGVPPQQRWAVDAQHTAFHPPDTSDACWVAHWAVCPIRVTDERPPAEPGLRLIWQANGREWSQRNEERYHPGFGT